MKVVKKLHTYTVVHESGVQEKVNATSMGEALRNIETDENTDTCIHALRVAQDIRTVVEEEKASATFTATTNIAECKVTPKAGSLHCGDTVHFASFPTRIHELVEWKKNGEFYSKESEFDHTFTESATFQAFFRLKDVEWKTKVEPAEAKQENCIAFPPEGVSSANASLKLLAEAATNWKFKEWRRNGVKIDGGRIIDIDKVTPLAPCEDECVFTAVFERV